MPWSNQNGGGGPWGGGGGNNQGPWGQGPNRPRGGGGKGGPPDLEDIIRRGQDQLRNIIPGGFNGGVAVIVVAIVAVFWLIQCVYTVQPDERGVELRFGKPREEVSMPGLHFHLWPMDSVEIVKVTEQQQNIGGRNNTNSTAGLMLSGDQNIVNVQFSVLYTVNDPKSYLFRLENPAETLQQVSESAMREIVGRRPAQDAFRDNRGPIETEVRNIIQDTMDRYGAGIAINRVTIEDVAPPREVADAFEEVQRADQDKQRLVEEANQYANQKLGQARGDAARIREDAAAYKNRIVKEAEGEAQRFISIYDEYSKAPDVTRQRLFLETMEQVLKGSKKVIIDEKQGIVPYLPLNEIGRPTQKQGG
ncbi:FtsH protease activity modulator HflK [Rhizobium sophorae]|uniref:Protein HflK n=1 Tax=Rhizobium sophorae TaxID=1535242 RepID=A0A7Y3S9W4_9HYPH|nr:FtsH protease activity modulator HflK [Rhizobium sophorae]MBX4859706.1 FtsH protease activity modulator HflK [Rhizobium bangladeshense]NKK71560.1 FtsH protease activity modulator HflK [Rhizobium leguminosarum bv. viciae]NKL32794.1 FtsH protease activity modulator HflK [Rhizobium leguminosarum bv. viciae]NNU39798.1 FtsH protease activity modulator HflK [Rhizobium sophorae]